MSIGLDYFMTHAGEEVIGCLGQREGPGYDLLDSLVLVSDIDDAIKCVLEEYEGYTLQYCREAGYVWAPKDDPPEDEWYYVGIKGASNPDEPDLKTTIELFGGLKQLLLALREAGLKGELAIRLGDDL